MNKFCLQSATGSGKTLLMHVNLLQYRHYAKQTGQDKEFSRVILLTPNERLSEQHLSEFRESGIPADLYLQTRGDGEGYCPVVQARLSLSDIDAQKAGKDFMFTLCSNECGFELKEALEQEKEIGNLLYSAEPN